MTSSPEFKLTVLGTGGVGKSATVIQFIQNYFVDEYDPTIEDSYRKQVLLDDHTCILDILDSAGREEYSAMRSQYIRQSQGFIIMYSVTDRRSFEELQTYWDQVKMEKERAGLPPVPIVLVGNKVDLEDDRMVTTLEGQELAKSWGKDVQFFEASAKTRINIEEQFYALARAVRDSISNPKPQQKKKKGILSNIKKWLVKS